MDEVYKALKDKHGEKYDTPKLRQWSRMIASNLHDLEKPPDIPAFSGVTPIRPRKESMTDAL